MHFHLKVIPVAVLFISFFLSSGASACDAKDISWAGWDTSENFYTYIITCNNGQSERHKIPIGIGTLKWNLDKQWTPDGCSGPMIKGDTKVWRVACNSHDVQYATLAPEGTDDNLWRRNIDLALMFNMASICQQYWPKGSPGLGGCFDGAKNTYNYLWILGFGKSAYETAQDWAKRNNQPRLTQAEFDSIISYNQARLEKWPVFGTDWDAGKGVLNPTTAR